MYREILDMDLGIPVDSLAKLEEWQDSTSTRKPIVDSIYYLQHIRAGNYGQMLRLAIGDSTVDFQRIIDSLETETDPQLKLLLAEIYVALEEYTDAENLYESIEPYGKEMQQLLEYKMIALNFEKFGWSWSEVDSSGEAAGYKSDLIDLANGDTTMGALLAQNVLSFLNDSIYPAIFLQLEGSSKRSVVEESKTQNQNEPLTPEVVKVYPNPAQNQLTVEYVADTESNELSSFIIYSIMGEQLLLVEWISDSKKLNIDINNLSDGFYLYRLYSDGQNIQEGKIVILR